MFRYFLRKMQSQNTVGQVGFPTNSKIRSVQLNKFSSLRMFLTTDSFSIYEAVVFTVLENFNNF